MSKYGFKFEIEAESETKARELAVSLDAIYKNTPPDDLLWVGKNVKEIPGLFTKLRKHPLVNTFLKSFK